MGGHGDEHRQPQLAGQHLHLGEVGERGVGIALVGEQRAPVEQGPGDAGPVAVAAQAGQRLAVAGERPVEVADPLVDEGGEEVDPAERGLGRALVGPGDLAAGRCRAAQAEQRDGERGTRQRLGLGVAAGAGELGGAPQVLDGRRRLAQLVVGQADHPFGHACDGPRLAVVGQNLRGPRAHGRGVTVTILGERPQLDGGRSVHHAAES